MEARIQQGNGSSVNSDRPLIDRARAGDREAFGLLYRRHVSTARRVAHHVLHSESDADDVVAEVFVALLAALESGRGPVDSFLPYLVASVRNESYRFLRRIAREREVGACQALVDAAAAPRDVSSEVAETDALRAALGNPATRDA